jgi:hypothetical protein
LWPRMLLSHERFKAVAFACHIGKRTSNTRAARWRIAVRERRHGHSLA